jgi:hypothetical protein
MNENACIGVNDMLGGHTSCKQKRAIALQKIPDQDYS